ncbi:hypothetical protein L1049_010056 [Liquidambar formosana]|uniref:Ribosomal RNA-processing protein 17 n=1 Tax=Liquidambar formosana TaxID=63359 RepID=A0AAP0N6Y8_LIQFO
MEVEADEEAALLSRPRARHIKKRALKNKALSVSFDEKDLKDFVGGFHKRKKKRRKEAELLVQEAQRRKRIEARKKRKLERESVYGGAVPATDSGSDECGEDDEQDEGSELVTSISGTATYDNGDMKVTVTTSEISREEDKFPSEKMQAAGTQINWRS